MEESNLSKYLNFVMSTDKSILPKKELSTGPRITEPKTDILTLALEQKKNNPKKDMVQTRVHYFQETCFLEKPNYILPDSINRVKIFKYFKPKHEGKLLPSTAQKISNLRILPSDKPAVQSFSKTG